jgi:hypothetical protein
MGLLKIDHRPLSHQSHRVFSEESQNIIADFELDKLQALEETGVQSQLKVDNADLLLVQASIEPIEISDETRRKVLSDEDSVISSSNSM